MLGRVDACRGKGERGKERLRIAGAVFLLVLVLGSGCGEPFMIVRPSVVEGRMVFEHCQSRWSCGQEWRGAGHDLVKLEDADGTPVREILWEFTVEDGNVEVSLPPVVAARLEIGAVYALDDCIFRYEGDSVQLVRKRSCGKRR